MNNELVALGWCFDSLKILPKIHSLCTAFQKRGIKCVWLCYSRETQYGMLSQGLLAFSVFDFLPLYKEVIRCGSEEFLRSEIENLSHYDRLSKRKITPLNIKDKDYYEAQTEFFIGVYCFLIHRYAPRLILNLNGLHCAAAALTAVARKRNIPVSFFENGLLPETLVIDSCGVNYGSHLSGSRWEHVGGGLPPDEELQRLKDYKSAMISSAKTLLEQGESVGRDELFHRLGLSPHTKIVLLPLQVDTDTNIIYYSPLFKSMRELVAFAAGFFKDRQDRVLIIKEHPKRAPNGDFEIQKFVSKNVFYITDIKITSLLDAADMVLCINSTVGLEALLRSIPVICLGQSVYSEKGFTLDAYKTKAPEMEVSRALQDEFISGPFNEFLFNKFLFYLLREHLFCTDPDLDFFQSRNRILTEILKKMKAACPLDRSIGDCPQSVLNAPLGRVEKTMRRLTDLASKSQGEIVLKGSLKPGLSRFFLNHLRKVYPKAKIRQAKSNALNLVPFWRHSNRVVLDFLRS